ncbi:hypothetical protein Tco_1310395, partial [Tanacetum coccineum]
PLSNIKVEFSVEDLETALISQNSTFFEISSLLDAMKYEEMQLLLDDVFLGCRKASEKLIIELESVKTVVEELVYVRKRVIDLDMDFQNTVGGANCPARFWKFKRCEVPVVDEYRTHSVQIVDRCRNMILYKEVEAKQCATNTLLCRHLCQHHVSSVATAAIVSVVCQANDHDFDGLGRFSALAWMPCAKGLSPVCLLDFRIIPSCLLLAASIANVATHGRSALGVGKVGDGSRHKISRGIKFLNQIYVIERLMILSD